MADAILAALNATACPWSEMPNTREGWDAAIGEAPIVTPFGEIGVAPVTTTLDGPVLCAIRPTLEAPAYVTMMGKAITFHRPVTAAGAHAYAMVTFTPDGVHASLGTSPPFVEQLFAAHGDITAELDNAGEAIFKALNVVQLSGLSAPDNVAVHVVNFALASTMMGWGGDFFKADYGPPPPGSRWITVHPNGQGSKGVPVLVQPVGDGSGHMRVIAGAGGKLNMLKLRGVKSPEAYREGHAERAHAKRTRIQEQRRRDKELGLHDAKSEARRKIKEQRTKAQKDFIATVAEAMGWDAGALHPQTAGLSPEAQKKAEEQHHRELLSQAKSAVSVQRRVLVANAEAREAAGLGTVPLHAPIDQLSVADLDNIRPADNSGISNNYGARAEAHGLTDEKLAEQIAELNVKLAKVSPDPAAALAKQALSDSIAAELADFHVPELKASIAEAEKAVALIKAQKQLQAIEKAAREANAEVDATTTEPQAYVLSVNNQVVDKAALATAQEDLRAARATAFLAGVDEVGGEDRVERHIHAGAYNAINALTHAVGGDAMLDRSVVDVLGIAGAAQILARRLHTDRPNDVHEIREAVASYHVAQQAEAQQEALEEAKSLQQLAAEIEVDDAANANDLAVAAAMAEQREEYLGQARKVMGQMLGEMEAHASLVTALGAKPADSLDVSLGRASNESAIKQLWALGLTDQDFELDRVEGNAFVRIKGEGLDKLAAPVDHEGLEQVHRNLRLMNGDEDEDDWLPDGFARRADLGLNLPAGVSPALAKPFRADAPDLTASLRDYIGGRVADGDRAADILADVQSASFFDKVGKGRSEEYRAALDAAVPTKDGKNVIRVEALEPIFEQYAGAYVDKLGGDRSTLNKQRFEPDALAQEALHRALADEPAGKLAYKPVGELSLSERGQLRRWFHANVAKASPQEQELRAAVEKHIAAEPEKFETDFFGETSVSPSWTEWKSELDQAQAKVSAASLDWNGYAHAMRGKVRAYEALQDLIRSKVSGAFAEHHNRLKPDAPIKSGRTVIRGNLNHLGAVNPEEREKRVAAERALTDGLRNRIGGKYASGSVADKLDALKEHEAAMGQAQMGFFSAEELGETEPKALGADERHTIGHAAEAMLGKMMQHAGRSFEPGKPVKLFRPSMSGPDGVKRQRMIKMIAQNKRVIGAAGVGSGKTAIGLGAFAHLHAAGKVKKGLYVVPSIVQEQFGGEALRFLEPGKFNWHAAPGASYEERMAGYKDPGTHFSVVTHQSFRDDVLRMGTEAGLGHTPDEVAAHLADLDVHGRRAAVRSILDHHGIAWDFAMADEAHGLLDREGKEDSRMSHAIQGVTDNVEHYFHASGDPVKNDASEAFSLLQKMDARRYHDRDAFMRRYGGDTRAAKAGLQRELARHMMAFSLRPDVKVDRKEISVEPSAAQHEALKAVDNHAGALRIAAMTGKVDIAAARALAPGMFEGADEADHEKLAGDAAKSVGILKAAATRRVLDAHPAAAKLDEIVSAAAARKGKQGVIFAHSLEAVAAIEKRLTAEGHRVTTLTGKDSAKDKGSKIKAFNPDKGDATADIIVCSDAGATGANLQSGRWLAQYDTPETAMTHAQRNGRIHRIGQQGDVELLDLVSNHESERRGRKRLAAKYDLRELLTTPLDGLDDTGLAYHLAQRGLGAAKPSQGALF